jgi:hypothetical protein
MASEAFEKWWTEHPEGETLEDYNLALAAWEARGRTFDPWVLEDLARMVESVRDGMVRSNTMMSVKEHRSLMTAAADGIRKGLVAL